MDLDRIVMTVAAADDLVKEDLDSGTDPSWVSLEGQNANSCRSRFYYPTLCGRGVNRQAVGG